MDPEDTTVIGNIENSVETEDEYRLAVIEIQDLYGSEIGD